MDNRHDDLTRFYKLLDALQQKLGGLHILSECNTRMKWSLRGVYFFMEVGEKRSSDENGLRIVRVGTHALASGSKSTLWGRLSQHKGQIKTGGGSHRGSIFRLLIGTAIINKTGLSFPTWGYKNTAKGDIRKNEEKMEQEVSKIIGAMPFLWLPINDESSPQSLRGYIERNSIALLSNLAKEVIDPPSPDWLGNYCNRKLVRDSGLWNQRHTNEEYDRNFLDVMEKLVNEVEGRP